MKVKIGKFIFSSGKRRRCPKCDSARIDRNKGYIKQYECLGCGYIFHGVKFMKNTLDIKIYFLSYSQ